MAATTCEIVWLRLLLAGLGVTLHHPTPLYCDNQSAIQIVCNSVFHEQTKHIEIDFHYTRHHMQLATITLPFVPSSLQIADLFTKAHSTSRFRFLVYKLSILIVVASWFWGGIYAYIYIYIYIYICISHYYYYCIRIISLFFISFFVVLGLYILKLFYFFAMQFIIQTYSFSLNP